MKTGLWVLASGFVIAALMVTSTLEGLAMLFPSFRKDRAFASVMPVEDMGWFRWGYVLRDGKRESWYILIALPCYSMWTPPWSWEGPDAPPKMHQHHLLFQEPLPTGDGKWCEILLECP